MPGSKGVLFNAFSSSPGAIAIQPFGKGERRDLIRGPVGTMASYLPSGHLTYAQEGRLMAVPFDLERLEVTGQPVPVVHDLLNVQAPQYSISATGSLVYVPGSRSRNRISQGRLVWVNRDGTEQSVGTPARTFNQPRLSPDGRRLAVDVIEPHGMQVWLYDFARDTFAPFTFDGVNRHAIWTPDGKRLAFMSNREGATQIFWQLADGSGGLERLTRNPPTTAADVLTIPYSWSPDGQRLLYLKLDPSKGPELWVLHAGASDDREAQRLPLQIRSPDGGPELSPDGHWLAYATDDGSGHREVFVQPYPGPGGKWQVSTDGGNEPLWNPNGRELFYRNGDRMMAVDITTQPGFAAGKPRQLFKGSYLTAYAGWVRPNYDVSPDGQRFLMLKPDDPEQVPLTQINVVLNWSEELKRLVPSK
jgi:Tol biopolymer transport system component